MTDIPTFYSVNRRTEVDLRERGSKFLGFIFPIWDDTAFDATMSEIRKKYYDASHHCSGVIRYAEPFFEQSHDDGEPSGTAGLPILNTMRSARLVNVGIIVVRYFGGTKLGKAGLIRSYSETAQSCIDDAVLHKVDLASTIRIVCSYDQLKYVEILFNRIQVERLESDYQERVTITIQLQAHLTQEMTRHLDQLSYLGIRYELIKTDLVMNLTQGSSH